MNWAGIDAVVFDMDGTLIDTEHHTESVVGSVLRSHGVERLGFAATELYGLTWDAAGQRVRTAHPELAEIDVSKALQEAFAVVLDREGLLLVPGADRFVASLKGSLPVALYTSNVRSEVDRLQREHPVFDGLDFVLTGEDVEHSKPHPEGYLRVAQHLQVDPARCLVFEDSVAGLQSARSAGMQTVGVLNRSPNRSVVESIADRVIDDYSAWLDAMA